MTVATQLKSMDFLMLTRASEGLTDFRGIAVSFLALLLGGTFLFRAFISLRDPAAVLGVSRILRSRMLIQT